MSKSLPALCKRIDATRARLGELVAERDQMIADAKDAGTLMADLEVQTGLSRDGLHRVLRKVRRA